jgi:excisionase family DNA binding protein
MDQLLTIKEVCEILQVSDDTIYKEIKDGKIAGTKIRTEWRFTKEALGEYLESRTVKASKRKSATFKA